MQPRRALVAAMMVVALSILYQLHANIDLLVHPTGSVLRPVSSPRWGNSTFLCDHRVSTVTKQPYCLHLLSLPSPSAFPPCHLLLIPGTSAHAAQYHSIAHILTATTLCSLHAVDLHGHGRSGGDRGTFSLHDFILDIEAAATHIQRSAYLAHPDHLHGKKSPLIRHAPILLLGSSQGGEVAYQALVHLPQSLVSGAIAMNLWLSSRLCPSRLMAFLTHPWLLPVTQLLLHHVRLPLPLFLPFPALYSAERPLGRRLYEEKLRDPLTQWSYALPSYLTLFLPPPIPHAPYHSLSRKRLLIVCGESDPVIRWEDCAEAWRLLREEGGEVDLYVWPKGVHQLLLLEGEGFGRLMGSWIAVVSEDIRREWQGRRRSNATRSWGPPEGFQRSVHKRTKHSDSGQNESRSEHL